MGLQESQLGRLLLFLQEHRPRLHGDLLLAGKRLLRINILRRLATNSVQRALVILCMPVRVLSGAGRQ